MDISLQEHFTYPKLLRFTVPTIIMMIVTSIYGVVDGLFVSNVVGKTAFAAVNLIMPFPMILSAAGFMVGTGGSALISKTLGEGDAEKANRMFSMLIDLTVLFGIFAAALSIALIRPIAIWMGAEGEMVELCVQYGRILLLAQPFAMLQYEFQSFLVTAEKPNFGLFITIGAGVTNMALDALFLLVFHWGVTGAALATALSQVVGAGIPLLYFIISKKSTLRLGRFSFDAKALLKTCANGSSELMSNISMSIVNILFNAQLMHFAGENGVAAYGVIMYVSFIFCGVFLGYSTGVAPVVGFHYGARDDAELKSLLKKSMTLLGALAVVLTALAELLSRPFAGIFVGYDPDLLAMTTRALRLYSLMYLINGFNIFASSFFTALNNGLVSAVISFLRTLVFQIGCVLVLPVLLDIDGIWLSVVAAEFLAAILSAGCIFRYRNRYHYM